LKLAAHETIHEYYLHQHRNIENYLELCSSHPEAELVHQLRLSIKKLQAFNKLAEQLCLTDTDEHIHINNRVRQLYKMAGELRDTQVQIHLLATFEEQTCTAFPEFSKWLLKREKKRIAQFSKNPRNVMSHTTAHITHHKIGQSLALASDESILNCADTVLAGLSAKAHKLSEGTIDDQNLHRIRIITKQIRYILNIMQHSYPDFKLDEISVGSLREIEAATGHWHDSLVKVELLSKCMGKMQSIDNTTMLKYKKFLSACNSELYNAYQEACKVVKQELLSVNKDYK